MKTFKNSLLTLFLLLNIVLGTKAQNFETWQISTNTEAQNATTANKGARHIIPKQYNTVHLNLENLKHLLSKAPFEDLQNINNQNFITIELPLPNGTFQRFKVVQTSIMEAALAREWDFIKTYVAQGIDDVYATARLDVTPAGFHAMVLTPNGTFFIDPYSTATTEFYISYYKKDFEPSAEKKHSMNCQQGKTSLELQNPKQNERGNEKNEIPPRPPRPNSHNNNNGGWRSPDGKLRTYRLALAATGEYTTFHGGTKTLAAAAMATSLNRINGVYERELSVRMNLVTNNNNIIYTNGVSDPYSNDDGLAMLTENTDNINSVIGSANYDIGHVFSTGGGGIAGLGVVCTSQKAEGVTGSSSPVGDPFDIDYVAHEMGHQFEGEHTFNDNSNGSCAGNRSSTSAYEPGGGSTIMAYAGICSPSDVQNNSDDYFHAHSLDQIYNFLLGTGNSCATKTTLANTSPVANAGANYTIPKSTPFVLTGSATDANNDALTYCWEEYDLGPATSLGNQNGNAPIIRTYDPVTSPSRTIPRLSVILNNTNTDPTDVELLPNATRTMTFRLTARDNKLGGGSMGYDDATVTIANSGPFLVTAPNTNGITWAGGSSVTITWNVASTTSAPVSCANVDIFLSTDGGTTFPYTLASATANDGTQTLTLPSNIPATTQARVKVQCNGNIFFDISNFNHTITAPTIPDFTITATPSTQTTCGGNLTYTVATNAILNFNTNIALTSSGLPSGLSGSFSPATIAPGSASSFVVTNNGSATNGTYAVTVTGTAGTAVHTATVAVVVASTPAAPTLTTPANNATGISNTPAFAWSAVTNATSYTLEIATDAAFTNIVQTVSNIATNSYTLTTALTSNTTYFWRIKSQNSCGTSTASSAFQFTTSNVLCQNFVSTDIPKVITANAPSTVNSTVTVSTTITSITDIDVLNLTGTHDWTGDLKFNLVTPNNTDISLFDFSVNCGDTQYTDFNLNFDDAAATTPPCTTTGGTYKTTSNALTTLNGGTNINGTWTLKVQDQYTQDGGQLDSWTLRVCGTAPAPTGVEVKIKAFLEGATSGTTMTTALKTANLLPIAQPYNIAPFNYTGTESVANTAALPTTFTDWVLVQIYSSAGILLATKAGWLLNTGDITAVGSTTAGITFTNIANGTPYYVAVRHRNHVPVMSANTITPANSLLSYDFSTAVAKAKGTNQQKLVGSIATLFAANPKAGDVISYNDFNVFKSGTNNTYTIADFNLDGQINNTDFNFYLSNASVIGIPVLRY